MASHIVNFLIFACVGVTVEVVFTAIAGFRNTKNVDLEGRSYVWMLPIYGAAYPMLVFSERYFDSTSLFVRGLAYTALIYIVEYISGWLLRKTLGKCPWEDNYNGSKYSVNNLIRIDFLPAWYFLALLLEKLFIHLR